LLIGGVLVVHGSVRRLVHRDQAYFCHLGFQRGDAAQRLNPGGFVHHLADFAPGLRHGEVTACTCVHVGAAHHVEDPAVGCGE